MPHYKLYHQAGSEGLDEASEKAMEWIASQCREVAKSHMELAVKAEGMQNLFLENRRLRTELRSFARHHRRSAWEHLEMARRAEAASHSEDADFVLTDMLRL